MQKIISSEVWYCAFKSIDIAGSIELKNFSNDIAGVILLDIGEHKQRLKDPSSQGTRVFVLTGFAGVFTAQ